MPRPPSNGRVTSPYGPRDIQVPGVGPFHYGEDTVGEGNVAPEAGTIVFALYSGVFGNIIGVRSGSVVWNIAHHAHLNGRARGERVAEGEFLAPMGSTGLATGPHAHAERRVNGGDSIQSGTHTNPRDYYGAGSQEGTELDAYERHMLEHVYHSLTPGIEGTKHNGPAYNKLLDAAGHAQVARESAGRIEQVVVGKIPRQGGAMPGDTDLRSVIGWFDQNMVVLRDHVSATVNEITKRLTAELAKVPGIDPKILREAVAKAVEGSKLDPAVIAAAVNEDAARRLAS